MTCSKKVRFKEDSSKQLMLLPPSPENLIEDKNHPIHVINRMIDKIDIKLLIKTHKGGGSPRYHPRILLKVIIFETSQNQRPSRGRTKCKLIDIKNQTVFYDNNCYTQIA